MRIENPYLREKPSIERIGTAWVVNWTEHHGSRVVLKGKRVGTFEEALAVARRVRDAAA